MANFESSVKVIPYSQERVYNKLSDLSNLEADVYKRQALFAERMAVLDPEHIEEYKAIIARLKDEQAADYKLCLLYTSRCV